MKKEVSIYIADKETVLSMSYGEVTRSETINYRRLKPEISGLFCPVIFGPLKDYECYCGKYKKSKDYGIVCVKCGVSILPSKVRRYRIGHINLRTPVPHPWFISSVSNIIMQKLNFSKKELSEIISYSRFYAIKNSKDKKILKDMSIDQTKFYEEYSIDYSDIFLSGGEFLQYKLSKIDSNYSSMIINVLPVLPADLRPLVMLDNKKYASSDLNLAYKKVINRNNRLDKLIEIDAPLIIINNEKSMLVNAIFDLFSSTDEKSTSKSLEDYIKGKQGVFRKNLLGKRVDFSARAVIVSGPYLKLSECGIPKKILLKLYEPLIISKLKKENDFLTFSEAKKITASGSSDIINILKKILEDQIIVLNRAPTLHKLSLQAFKPLLVEGEAVHLHPLVCSGYNADFDGDTMNILPCLYKPAIEEAKKFMMVSKNIFIPSNGEPSILPSKDIVLGIYYLTSDFKPSSNLTLISSDYREIVKMIYANEIHIHDKIIFLIDNISYITTPGRVYLWSKIRNNNIFPDFNQQISKKELNKICLFLMKNYDSDIVCNFLDDIKETGFKFLTISGISFSNYDAALSLERENIISQSKEQIEKYKELEKEGLITKKERISKIRQEWINTSKNVSDEVMNHLAKSKYNNEEENDILMMCKSGARGSKSQLHHLCGMRGFIVKPTGEVHESIIESNLKIGLNKYDYFNSTHGERKGLSDTALKTAKAGYFTRRLVDSAHASYIYGDDCGSEEFIELGASDTGYNFSKHLIGRVLAEKIDNIADKGEIITYKIFEKIKYKNVKIRSPIFCHQTRGRICTACYGNDVSTNKIVDKGLSVGIVAAQSIGEPGTQLTMRTFHLEGGANENLDSNIIYNALISGYISLKHANFAVNSYFSTFIMDYQSKIEIIDEGGEKVEIDLPFGTELLVNTEMEFVEKNTMIAIFQKSIINTISSIEGTVRFINLDKDNNLQQTLDHKTGLLINKTKDYFPKSVTPFIEVYNDLETKIYRVNTNVLIMVKNGQKVIRGDILCRENIQSEGTEHKDITGGLPKVIEIFDVKKHINPAVLSPESGIVSIIDNKVLVNNKKVLINSKNSLCVSNGSYIEKGDKLTYGEIIINDLINYKGIIPAIKYIASSILNIYEQQGATINLKHIEVILKQNLKMVKTDEGIVTLRSVLRHNRANKENKIKFNHLIFGITKIATDYSGSFISSASFQNTTKVLVRACLNKEKDYLYGIKERIIIGKLIPLRGQEDEIE